MIYTADITTSADTAETNPDKTVLRVTKGLVYQVEIDFPFGSAGLLHCQIFDGGFQVWPSTPGESFHTPGFVISFEDTYLKEAGPFRFDILTWNLDDTLDHFLQVRVGMVSKEAFMARFMPGMVYQDMLAVLEGLRERQEAERQAILGKPFDWFLKVE